MFVILFKGGEVHDGSELIGPAEPFSDFLADSLSDCSSDGGLHTITIPQNPFSFCFTWLWPHTEMFDHVFSVQRDISGADDLTITSEYGGKV